MTELHCPKCKNSISADDIRCPHCNMRLKVICPSCNTANHFGTEFCTNCGTMLLKYCDNCQAANLPTATECRKCHTPFEEKILTFEKRRKKQQKTSNNPVIIEEPQIQPEVAPVKEPEDVDPEQITPIQNIKQEATNTITEEQIVEKETANPTIDELLSRHEEKSKEEIQLNNDFDKEIVFFDNAQTLLEQLSNIMQTENNAVITAIAAEEGMGKTTIIKTFADSFTEKGIVPITSECSELIKVSPFGCIRDSLLKLLTLPDIHPDIQSFYSEQTKQLFIQNFEELTDSDILNFMNFLYPTMQGSFEDIIVNKNKVYELLDKILQSIISKNRAIVIIDNYDLIDNASYEYINHLIKDGIINNKVKLFVSYREKKPAKLYFNNDIENNNIFTTLYLNNLNETETEKLIKSFANTPNVPTAISYTINEKGKGNIFFTEQFLSLLFDVGYMFISSNMMKFKDDEPLPFLPKNIEEVIQLRLNSIEIQELKDSLITASILGYKFDKSAFTAITDISETQTDDLLQKLEDLMFIQKASDYEYAFKNLTTWSVIFEIAQKDPRFKIICKKVYYILGKYALSNPTLKATVAKYRDEAEVATQSWKDVAAYCAYLGDINIYTTALEQFLENSGYTPDLKECTDEQTKAVEKLGKLTYKTNPQKAISYLTNPIIAAKDSGDITKTIELCGYLIKACYEVSDYNGVIEAVDVIINTAESELSTLDKALIKSKKLNALFKTGNCEEGINLANNEILGPLEESLSKQNDPEFSKSLFTAWFETSINLINLYALQGNAKSIEVADNTAEIMQMNNIQRPDYKVKLLISKAFALTIAGKIQDSYNLLQEVSKIQEYNNSKFIAQRNLIYAMNLVFTENTENLKEQLFEFAQYADNAHDQFGKHIYKMMLAWLTYTEGDFAKANIIFNEELTYFAKEKTVTGALISWLFIAKSTLATEGAENAEHIAMKALEVAQNPKFSQYHMAVYLQKLIAEINLIKGDANAAKMYLEKGMLIAKQFGLDLAQIEMYRTYAKFLEQTLTMPNVSKADIAEKANKIYQAAIIGADKIKVPELLAKIQNDNKLLLDYCAKNNIAVK